MQVVKQTKGMGFLYTLLKDEATDKLVALMRADGRTWNVGDRVFVSEDKNGGVCDGIEKCGHGNITEIRDDSNCRWLGIKMDNGEFGFVKMALVTMCNPHTVLAGLGGL